MANSYPLNTFISELQAAFSSRGMTLPADTASAWIRSEQSVSNGNIVWNSGSAAVYNNPLGLGWNGSTWNQYTSFNQAAQAYANTISQYYPKVESILSNPNVSSAAASEAIATSPWAGSSGYGSNSPIRAAAKPQTLFDYLLGAGINVSPNETYSQISSQFQTVASNDTQFQPWLRALPVLNAQFKPYTNTAISKIPFNRAAFSGTWNPVQPGGTNPPDYTGVGGVLGNLLPDVQSAIGFIGVILIGLVFILGAFILSKNDKSQVVII